VLPLLGCEGAESPAPAGTSSGNGGTTSGAGPGAAGQAGSSPASGGNGAAGRPGASGSSGALGAAGSDGVGVAGFAGMVNAGGSGGLIGAAGMSAGGMTGTAGRDGSSAGAGLGGTGAGAAGTGGASTAATCPAAATAKAGETTESIMVGGTARTFLLHIPQGYTGDEPLPVVIDFHPLGGTGSSQKGLSGWGTLADSEGFIVVWPDGIGNSWNVGRCCSTAQSQNVDDVAFTKAIIATLGEKACIDPKRVYATGCSNGGGMAFKVACDAADVIAAVAPVDFDCVNGPSAEPSCGSCAPTRPVGEIQFRGTNDTAVPYGGGSGPAGTAFPGAEANFSEWAEINGCTGVAMDVPEHAGCQAYGMCGGDVATVLCTVQNGSHCGSYKSFGIIDIAWEMFQKSAIP
jgi:polyhydroxybutyrate depolymerase